MKFCFVCWGIIEIPPKSWGAVEIIIWDYKHYLEALGHEVKIVNTLDKDAIEEEINSFSPDVCHCHYDGYYDILERCKSKLKIMTSHCGSIRGNPKHDAHFRTNIMPYLNSEEFYNFCLDSFIKNLYLANSFYPNRQFVVPNAARKDLIRFEKVPRTTDTVCIGRIQYRKRQYLLKDMNVFFVGEVGDDSLSKENKRIVGSWTKEKLYSDLTHNANLVLLSSSEAAPLVTLESMMAGLGLVISEACTANLDLTLPFIDIIPEEKIGDQDYIAKIIEKNKRTSLSMREDIRKYAEENHSYEVIVSRYLETIRSIS